MKKKKLIVSLCAIALIVAIGVVGVLAASSQSVQVSTTITFAASDVDCYVTLAGSNNGTPIDLNGTDTGTDKEWNIDASEGNAFNHVDGISGGILFADQANAYIQFTFTVTNRSTTEIMTAQLTVTYGSDGTGTDSPDNTVVVTYDSESQTIAAGQSTTITYKITLTDPSVDVNYTQINLKLALAHPNET